MRAISKSVFTAHPMSCCIVVIHCDVLIILGFAIKFTVGNFLHHNVPQTNELKMHYLNAKITTCPQILTGYIIKFLHEIAETLCILVSYIFR
jgi:hypothetical protein